MDQNSIQAFAAHLARESNEELTFSAQYYPNLLNDIDSDKRSYLKASDREAAVIQQKMVQDEIARRAAAK